jgi:hypothetical protein
MAGPGLSLASRDAPGGMMGLATYMLSAPGMTPWPMTAPAPAAGSWCWSTVAQAGMQYTGHALVAPQGSSHYEAATGGAGASGAAGGYVGAQ